MVLKNASAFISISPWYIKKINNLINVKGYLIENGYDLDNDENKGCKNLDPIIKMEQVLDCNKFNIIYPGTLYKTQSLQYFADMLSYLNPEILRKISFKIIGMKESDVLSKHIVLNKYHPWLVNIYERVDKSIADKYMIDAEAVLHIAHVDSDGNIIKGIPSSKLYDYIKYKKCVIMAPPDKDIAQEKLTTCGLGIVSESPMELSIKITKLVEDWLVNGSHPNPTVNIIEYQKNTRECRVEELAKILDIYFS